MSIAAKRKDFVKDEPAAEPEPIAEEAKAEGEDEVYSAQCLRQMHEHAMILLEEYDEMGKLLEHEPIQNMLHEKLESLVEELEKLEAAFQEHHPDLPPLEGAEGAKDMGDDGEGDAEQADSEKQDEPTPDEAVEGMKTKALSQQARKALKGKWHRKAACPTCGKDPCICKSLKNGRKDAELGIEGEHKPGGEEEKKDLGIEGSHEPGEEAKKEEAKRLKKKDMNPINAEATNDFQGGSQEMPDDSLKGEKGLLPHHKKQIDEASGFLHELAGTHSHDFSHEHRLKSFHHGENLEDAAEHLQKSFGEADRQDQAAEVNEPGEAGQKNGEFGIEGSHEPGSEAKKEEAKRLKKDMGSGEFEEIDKLDDRSNVQEPGQKMMGWHKALTEAGSYLKDVAATQDFTTDHQGKALYHHKTLDPIGKEDAEEEVQEGDNQAIEPGSMDTKALLKMQQQQNKDLLEFNRKMVLLGRKLAKA